MHLSIKARIAISVLCLATFLILNIFAALINSYIGNFRPGQLSDFTDSVTACSITSVLILISLLPSVKLAYHWRLPLFRVVFWLILCFLDYGNKTLYPYSGMLGITNSFLCFFYDSVLFGIFDGNIPEIKDDAARLIFIDIIGIALYEIFVIKVATYFLNVFQSKRSVSVINVQKDRNLKKP